MDNNQDYIKKLENVIKQMLKPLRDIPFNLVIETITGKKVISFDFNNKEHAGIRITKTSSFDGW